MVKNTKKKEIVKNQAIKAPLMLSKPALQQSKGQDLQVFWQAEIKELQNVKFATYVKAVDAVLVRVCNRLQVPATKQKATIERLRVIFDTSDLLKQSLYKNLKIVK